MDAEDKGAKPEETSAEALEPNPAPARRGSPKLIWALLGALIFIPLAFSPPPAKPPPKPVLESEAPRTAPLASWEKRWRDKPPAPKNLRQSMEVETGIGERLMSLVGLAFLVGICLLFSKNKRRVSWRLVGVGLALQIFLGVILLRTPLGEAFFGGINESVKALLSYSDRGAAFLFGDLIKFQFAEAFIAFSVLSTIIFFSAFVTVLYHLGTMQLIVKGLSAVMRKTMGTSGAETLSAAGNIFVGQTEAPLLIKPFVKGMTESELMAVMTGGFATVAGGVLAAYVGMLRPYFPDVAGHLLSASIMSAPAALVCAKLLIPEPDPTRCETYGAMRVQLDRPDANIIDAACRGAGEGLKLALNVGAMLLVFVALVALANDVLGGFCHLVGIDSLLGLEGNQRVSLELIFGKLMAPVAFLMGVPWEDAEKVGQLFGLKTVLNEFFAYFQLANGFAADPNYLQPRSLIIACYGLCGFANFSSIAIQIGGISGIAPERRSDLARLGLRAMFGGTVAAFMTGTVAGLLI